MNKKTIPVIIVLFVVLIGIFSCGCLRKTDVTDSSLENTKPIDSEVASTEADYNTDKQDNSSSMTPAVRNAITPETPVVAVAKVIKYTGSDGKEYSDGGFDIVDEDGNVVSSVSSDSLTMKRLESIKDKTSNEYISLNADTKAAEDIEDLNNGAVICSFILSLADDGNEDAKKVNDGLLGLEFDFACITDGTLPRVYHNGKSVDVSSSDNGTYTCTLFKEGSVIVAIDALG